jgi:hypothetical protein
MMKIQTVTNIDELTRKVQRVAARTKEQAARLNDNDNDNDAYKLIADMFGKETAAKLRKKAKGYRVGLKASAISDGLLQAITDELGEEVAERIVAMLSSDETADDETEEDVTMSDDDAKSKSRDPFWAFALKARKPELPAVVRYQQDPFWKAFLKPE